MARSASSARTVSKTTKPTKKSPAPSRRTAAKPPAKKNHTPPKAAPQQFATEGHGRAVPQQLKHRARRAYPGLRHIGRIIAGSAIIVLLMTPTEELVRYDVDGAMFIALALLALLLTLFILFLRWRLKKLEAAAYPGWAALELYALAVVMFVAIFSKLYLMISLTNPQAFTEQLDHFTSYYFALTVLATVGFGDITPVTVVARALTMVQMALDLAFIALLVRLVSTHRDRAHAQRRAATSSTS